MDKCLVEGKRGCRSHKRAKLKAGMADWEQHQSHVQALDHQSWGGGQGKLGKALFYEDLGGWVWWKPGKIHPGSHAYLSG